jgi:hypothetical protein
MRDTIKNTNELRRGAPLGSSFVLSVPGQSRHKAAKRMIQRSLERFDLYPGRILGDSAYGSAEMLGWLLYEHGIEPHVTVFDKSARTDGTFSRQDFTYDHAGDIYRCPGGKTLTTTGTPVNDDATIASTIVKHAL